VAVVVATGEVMAEIVRPVMVFPAWVERSPALSERQHLQPLIVCEDLL
jgi:hypothetical protein